MLAVRHFSIIPHRPPVLRLLLCSVVLFICTASAAADLVVFHSSFLLLDFCVDCDLICDPYPIPYDLQAAGLSFPSFLPFFFPSSFSLFQQEERRRRCDTNRQLDLVVMSLRRRVTALLVAIEDASSL
jgi:hypothetical protein